MDDRQVEDLLKRYRPAGPPDSLRERCLTPSSAARVWPWAAAAAALLAITVGLEVAAADAIAGAKCRGDADHDCAGDRRTGGGARRRRRRAAGGRADHRRADASRSRDRSRGPRRRRERCHERAAGHSQSRHRLRRHPDSGGGSPAVGLRRAAPADRGGRSDPREGRAGHRTGGGLGPRHPSTASRSVRDGCTWPRRSWRRTKPTTMLPDRVRRPRMAVGRASPRHRPPPAERLQALISSVE